MAETNESTSRSRPRRLLTGVAGRAASLTVKPLSSAAAGAVQASIELERAALERVLDSPQFEQLVSSAVNSERVHEAALRLFESDAAKRLIAGFFDSGLFDEFAARLLESDALWEMIDRIADSPAVTAAISQQGLGFADQMGEEVRVRSRSADDWLERTARRLTRLRERALPPGGEDPSPATS
jgi:hypothetical protein